MRCKSTLLVRQPLCCKQLQVLDYMNALLTNILETVSTAVISAEEIFMELENLSPDALTDWMA